MPLILPGNVASATASTTFSVANSCRFNDGDSADLSLTLGSSLGTRSLYTFSCWIKRGVLGTTQNLFDGTDGTYPTTFSISSADKLVFYDTGENATFTSDAVLRDSAAWYHLVCRVDTSQASNENRVKFYINGVQATTTQTNTLTQDGNISWGKEVAHYVGGRANYFDGYMAEVVWITASSLAPTSFGEFDEDSPTIWKPIDVSELTFGTHGFYLDFEASDNLGNDANGGTDWTETNLDATDQASDSPTNNFCTMNPLFIYPNNNTFSEGNCVVSGTASAWQLSRGTIGVSQGKWFWEILFVASPNYYSQAGIVDESTTGASSTAEDGTTLFHNGDDGAMYRHGTDFGGTLGWDYGAYGTMDGSSDILGVALNADDDQITLYKNGAAIVSDFGLDVPATLLFPLASQHGSGRVSKYNFGGCSGFTVSSGNADADGYGNFEYAVPSGYYALCTKNLAEYG